MTDLVQDQRFITLAAEIVAAYVSSNSVPASELPSLIGSVHASLSRVAGKVGKTEEPVKQALTPPVPIRKSITDEYLICLEDGKHFKSLKRHLYTVYGLTPDEYRQKWGLSRDYPMVAPAYAKARSALAKEMGLGASRRKPMADFPESENQATAMESASLPTSESEAEPAPVPKKGATGRKRRANT